MLWRLVCEGQVGLKRNARKLKGNTKVEGDSHCRCGNWKCTEEESSSFSLVRRWFCSYASRTKSWTLPVSPSNNNGLTKPTCIIPFLNPHNPQAAVLSTCFITTTTTSTVCPNGSSQRQFSNFSQPHLILENIVEWVAYMSAAFWGLGPGCSTGQSHSYEKRTQAPSSRSASHDCDKCMYQPSNHLTAVPHTILLSSSATSYSVQVFR